MWRVEAIARGCWDGTGCGARTTGGESGGDPKRNH
jgi:hypothetical protein